MHRCTSLEHFLLSVEWSLISLFPKHSNADIEKESREIPTMNQTVHDEPRGNQVQINEEHNPSKSNFRKIYTLRFSHWLSGVDGGGGVIGGVSGGVPGSVPPNPANNSGGVIGTGVAASSRGVFGTISMISLRPSSGVCAGDSTHGSGYSSNHHSDIWEVGVFKPDRSRGDLLRSVAPSNSEGIIKWMDSAAVIQADLGSDEDLRWGNIVM